MTIQQEIDSLKKYEINSPIIRSVIRDALNIGFMDDINRPMSSQIRWLIKNNYVVARALHELENAIILERNKEIDKLSQ